MMMMVMKWGRWRREMKGGVGWRASRWVLGDLGRGREYVVSWKKGF